MDFDFNLILVPVTTLFFIIWLLDKLLFKQRKTYQIMQNSLQQLKQKADAAKDKAAYIANESNAEQIAELKQDAENTHKAYESAKLSASQKTENPLVTWAYEFWPVLAIVLCARSFIYEPFNIPSESMVPGLQVGDYILVEKYAYGLRLPLLNTKIVNVGDPKRGEVFVFRFPGDPKISYIKRVMGVPGDHIVFHEGLLTINGETLNKVAQPTMGDSNFESFSLETLNGHTHQIREMKSAWSAAQAPFIQKHLEMLPEHLQQQSTNGVDAQMDGHHWEVTVPAGHYFAMGDNRDNSADSRFWGFVPEENLSGRAMYIWMHKKPGWHLPSFSRNGKIN